MLPIKYLQSPTSKETHGVMHAIDSPITFGNDSDLEDSTVISVEEYASIRSSFSKYPANVVIFWRLNDSIVLLLIKIPFLPLTI